MGQTKEPGHRRVKFVVVTSMQSANRNAVKGKDLSSRIPAAMLTAHTKARWSEEPAQENRQVLGLFILSFSLAFTHACLQCPPQPWGRC